MWGVGVLGGREHVLISSYEIELLIVLKCRHIFVDVSLIRIVYLFIFFAREALKVAIAKPDPRSLGARSDLHRVCTVHHFSPIGRPCVPEPVQDSGTK